MKRDLCPNAANGLELTGHRWYIVYFVEVVAQQPKLTRLKPFGNISMLDVLNTRPHNMTSHPHLLAQQSRLMISRVTVPHFIIESSQRVACGCLRHGNPHPRPWVAELVNHSVSSRPFTVQDLVPGHTGDWATHHSNAHSMKYPTLSPPPTKLQPSPSSQISSVHLYHFFRIVMGIVTGHNKSTTKQ